MESKAPVPFTLLNSPSAPAIIAAYFEFNHLKQLYRQGWLKRGVPKERCESVAEHTFGVAALALLLAEAHFPELNANRVLRMALIHDFGEVYAGDMIPGDNVAKEEKHRLERQAVEQIFSRLPNGERYLELWLEYEDGQTPEAHFVKEIDRLEMALQASVYEHQGFLNMEEFYASASQALVSPPLAGLMQAILDLRSGA